jgi:zinc transporter ZupT
VIEHRTPEEPAAPRVALTETAEQARARERAVASMVSASVLAIMGTLIFAWALRATAYPWLFAVGAVPWSIGVCVFARAMWKYTRN